MQKNLPGKTLEHAKLLNIYAYSDIFQDSMTNW